MNSMPWRIRAVQLDLARQMETVDFVCRYADFAAAQGFNTLFLYLEGRVRTPAFPYRPAAESYTLEEVERIVRHAAAAGLDVVPGLSTLGHAEHFFSCPEMAPLAEERDGATRFGGTARTTFCPSLPETYDFLRAYFAELAQVFTGPHFHVGLDEAWNMGYCHLCRERWDREGLGALFTGHLQRVDQICRDLGKRTWIWDDMYEVFPQELESAPRGVVMTHWNYDEEIEPEGVQAHFVNRWRQDWLKEYARLGFDAIIAPRSPVVQNVLSFTHYGRRHPLLGGLLTQWEMSTRFHEEVAPIIAFTGRMWNAQTPDAERAWEKSIQAVVPEAWPALAAAVRTLSEIPRAYPRSPSPQAYLCGPLSRGERLQRSAVQAGLELLRLARKGQADGTAVLDDLDLSARIELLFWGLRDLLPAIYDPRRPAEDTPLLQERAVALRQEMDSLIALRAPMHERLRAGMCPEGHGTRHLTGLRDGLAPAWERLARGAEESDWWLVLRLFLPDIHGAGSLKVAGLFGGEPRTLIEGCFKPAFQSPGSHYTLQVPFASSEAPEGVRLEVCGYGGQGVAFLEAQNRSRTLMPARIGGADGLVTRPEAVLRDDSAWAFLGNPDITAAMHDPTLAGDAAVLEIALAER